MIILCNFAQNISFVQSLFLKNMFVLVLHNVVISSLSHFVPILYYVNYVIFVYIIYIHNLFTHNLNNSFFVYIITYQIIINKLLNQNLKIREQKFENQKIIN